MGEAVYEDPRGVTIADLLRHEPRTVTIFAWLDGRGRKVECVPPLTVAACRHGLCGQRWVGSEQDFMGGSG